METQAIYVDQLQRDIIRDVIPRHKMTSLRTDLITFDLSVEWILSCQHDTTHKDTA